MRRNEYQEDENFVLIVIGNVVVVILNFVDTFRDNIKKFAGNYMRSPYPPF